MPPSPPDILVIIPAYNEEATVGNVIGDVRTHLEGADIALVDDGSTDRTAACALETGAVVLRLPLNLGIGGAVQTGFMYASRRSYAFAIQIDADGQHPASEAPALIAAARAGTGDVVIGSRFANPVRAGQAGAKSPDPAGGSRSTAARRTGIRLLALVSRITSGVSIQDCTSGFRVYNRRAFTFLSECYPGDYPEVEAITLLAANGFRIVEAPVKMRERQGGASSITLSRAIYYMIKVTMASCISRFRPRRSGS